MASDVTSFRRSGFPTWLAVSAFFAMWSLLHVAVPGVNEPHYLGKARAFSDPDWCAGDFFLHSANAHAVFFNIVGPLTQILPLAAVAVAGRIVSALILGWGWFRLCAALELSRTDTVRSAAVLGAIALTGSFSGEWILGGFESKVPAFGFAFAAIGKWMTCSSVNRLRGWIIAGVFAGVAIALHPVVGSWFLIGMGTATIAETILTRRQAPPTECTSVGCSYVSLIVMTLAAAATALPGLIPVLRMLSSSTLPPEARAMADRIQVFERLKHHLDPTRFPVDAWLHAAILVVLVLVGSWWLRKSEYRSMLTRILLVLAAALVIAAVGVAVGWHRGPVADLPSWSGRAFLLKFYPFRFVDALLPVTTALILAAVAGKVGPAALRRSRWTGGLIVLVLAAAFVTRQRTPSGYSAASYAEWREACAWIRDNVPAESLIFTPRESFAFKWLAERPEYVCYKDCPQDAAGILEWYRRLQSVDWLDPHRLQQPPIPADLRRLRSETGVTHVITRWFTVRDVEPRFENSTWRVYDVH